VLERLVEKGFVHCASDIPRESQILYANIPSTLNWRFHPVGKEISKKEAQLEHFYKKTKTVITNGGVRGMRAEKELKGEISFLKQEIKNLKKEVFERRG